MGTLFPNRAEAQKNQRLDTLNIRDFGAIGDGQSHPLGQSYTTFRRAVQKFPALQWLTDQDTWENVETDWAAIQSAIDTVPESIPGLPSTVGGIVFFPPGVYRINRSIEVIDNLKHHFRHNIQLNGSNGGSGGFMGCVIEWAGEPSEPIVRLFSRDCILQHIAFRVQPGNSTRVAIDVDQAPGPEHGICSGNTFEYIQIVGANGPFGHMRDGIRLGQTAPTNVEQMFFKKCMISVIDQACLHIPSETFQSKHHSFMDCTFDRAEFGIKTSTGSFQTYNCGFSSLGVGIGLGSGTDNILIQDCDSERCERFLTTEGSSAGCWPVSIIGGRFSIGELADDGEYIVYTVGGPFLIQSAIFEPGYKAAFKIRAETASPGTSFLSIGNCFPNEAPYRVTRGAQRRISLGNAGVDAARFPIHLADEMLGFNT